jgi:adenine-specific DNA-methyltransferase
MDKLTMHWPGLTKQNVDKLAALFPTVVTESLDSDGNPVRAIDFDLLRQELSNHVVEGPQERYQLDWPGKREALFAANAPIAKTLRPDRDASVHFDTTQNLFIEGDNLDALKLLQESYLGKVKLIYIDPPYNTGGDFIYDDDFAETADEYLSRSTQVDEERNRLVANTDRNGRFHSDWLSMMYPRLRLARDLLRDDGAIFISIDDNEVANLKRIAAEIFGAQNFVAQVIWQKVYSPKNSAQWFSADHDYILVFARNKASWQPRRLARTEAMEKRYRNPDDDPRGPWKPVDMSARNRYDAGVYSVTTPSGRVIDGPPTGRYWGISREKFEEYDADDRIWWGTDGENAPAIKRFLSEVADGRIPQTLWFYDDVGHTQDAKKMLLEYVPFEHTANVLNSVKPVALIRRVLQLATSPDQGDIIVDFFSGSGTTAHAVLSQNAEDGGNRRFIAVQIDEPLPIPEQSFDSILGMALTRIRNVAAGLRDDSAAVSDAVDLGFRVLRVDTTNMADVLRAPDDVTQEELGIYTESVKSSRTGEDLLFQVLLDWGLELAMPITSERIDDYQVFVVEGGALIACFEREIGPALVRTIASRQPLRAVFLDAGFVTDSDRINAEQIFAEVSPSTDVKAI